MVYHIPAGRSTASSDLALKARGQPVIDRVLLCR